MNPKHKMQKRTRRKEKKKFGPKFVIGGLFVLLMVMSIFGIIMGGFESGSEDIEYNNFKFTRTQEGFVTRISGQNYLFLHLPQEVEHINISENLLEKLRATPQIDITTSPDGPMKGEIAGSMFYFDTLIEKNLAKHVRSGFTEENEYNITVISCDDATGIVPILVFEYANQTGIVERGPCTYLQADSPDDIQRVTTRMLYSLLGII